MATAKLKTETQVYERVRNRFSQKGAYAFFRTVRAQLTTSGRTQERWADAVAMGLWKTRTDHELLGFEIKVSRSDWLRELKSHSKSEAVGRFCHRWWIAVGDKEIVKLDELPDTWGLLVPHGNTMRVAKKAPKLEPEPMTRAFIASLLKRASESFDEDALTRKIRAEIRSEVEASSREAHQIAMSGLVRELEACQARERECLEQLQVAADRNFRTEQIGRAIALLERLQGWRGSAAELKTMAGSLEADARSLGDHAATFRTAHALASELTTGEHVCPECSRKIDPVRNACPHCQPAPRGPAFVSTGHG